MLPDISLVGIGVSLISIESLLLGVAAVFISYLNNNYMLNETDGHASEKYVIEKDEIEMICLVLSGDKKVNLFSNRDAYTRLIICHIVWI